MTDPQQSPNLENIDERILELIERRLEEKLVQRVETTLKWRYGLVAVAFVSALVVAGIAWNKIIEVAVDGVVRQAQTDIENKIKDLSRTAEDSSKRVDVTFAVAEQMAKQGADIVAAANKKLAEVRPTIDAISMLEDRQKDLDARTKDLVVTVGSQPIATLIDDLRAQLAAVGEQVDRLSQIVAKLPDANTLTAADGSTATNVQADVANLVQRTDEQVRQSADARKLPTVFIQFAGAPRPQAQELGTALRAAGYNVPPEDREINATRQHEVRFFNEVDAAPAERLVAATNKALVDLGYSGPTVQKVDATSFRGMKPRPGVLELWIELPRLP